MRSPDSSTIQIERPSVLTYEPASSPGSRRVLSLDVFRGATVAGMILVNNPGSWSNIYGPLKHAPWHGATPTDWIFPFFLFIVGVAIPFSQSTRTSKSEQIRRIIRRSLTLFLLGMFLVAIPYSYTTGLFAPARMRIPGVLQRIAVCYAIVATLALFFRHRGMVAAAICAMTLYLVVMLAGPVDARYAADGRWSKAGSVEARVDAAVFGFHNYEKPPANDFFFDPEGVVSTLGAVATTIFGWLIGVLLIRGAASGDEKASRIFVVGVVALVAAFIVEAAGVPINKQLWTPSYVLYAAGVACLALGLCYWLIDVRGRRGAWTVPFVAMGRNAIVIFVLAGAIARLMSMQAITTSSGGRMSIKGSMYQPIAKAFTTPESASLTWAILFVGFFVALSMIMYHKRVFVRV